MRADTVGGVKTGRCERGVNECLTSRVARLNVVLALPYYSKLDQGMIMPNASMERREFISASAAALAVWLPAFRVSPASAQATCAPPPDFPSNIPLYQQAYQNWSREIRISSLWTCAPRNATEVLQIVEWARHRNYKV